MVLRQIGDHRWELGGETSRRPGLTARAARALAVTEALGRRPARGETFAAILRSEWRIAFEL